MKNVLTLSLLLLPFLALAQVERMDTVIFSRPMEGRIAFPRQIRHGVRLNFDSIYPVSSPSKSEQGITLDGVIGCISMEDAGLYDTLKSLCQIWYEIEKNSGCSDKEAALITAQKLQSVLIEMMPK